MENNQQVFKELAEIARPLKEFLEKYGNPHCAIIVDMDTVKMVSTKLSTPFADNSNKEGSD